MSFEGSWKSFRISARRYTYHFPPLFHSCQYHSKQYSVNHPLCIYCSPVSQFPVQAYCKWSVKSYYSSEGNIQSNARGLMTSLPDTISKDEIAAAALQRMEVSSITSLIVMEKGEREIAGVIHLHHLLRAGVV